MARFESDTELEYMTELRKKIPDKGLKRYSQAYDKFPREFLVDLYKRGYVSESQYVYFRMFYLSREIDGAYLCFINMKTFPKYIGISEKNFRKLLFFWKENNLIHELAKKDTGKYVFLFNGNLAIKKSPSGKRPPLTRIRMKKPEDNCDENS